MNSSKKSNLRTINNKLSEQDDDFEDTGSFSITMGFSVKVTEKDLLNDLVNRIEGEMVKPDEPEQHSKN